MKTNLHILDLGGDLLELVGEAVAFGGLLLELRLSVSQFRPRFYECRLELRQIALRLRFLTAQRV